MMKYLKTIFFFLVLMSFFILFKVNALEIYSGSTSNRIVASSYDRNYNGYYIKDNLNGANSWTHNFEFNNFTISNEDYFIINLLYDYRTYSAFSGSLNENGQQFEWYSMDCKTWAQRQQTYADGTTSTYYVCSQWDTYDEDGTYSGTITFNDFRQNSINEIGLEVDLLTDNNYWTSCELQNETTNTIRLVCPINTNRTMINRLRVRYTNPNLYNVNSDIHIGLANTYNLLKSDATSIIENQNQNQQQSHQDMQNINNSINNNNVSGANQDATNFVNNQAFQDNTGLTGIITAPLSVINSLTSSCSPIRLPIPFLNTNVDIPCIGDLLSSKMGALIQLVKVVINGYICYLIGLDMFKIVKHARDPNDDRIEVLDL